MIARRRQVALALTALLAAGAACQARSAGDGGAAGRPAPAASGTFTLVASGGVLTNASVADRAHFDAGGEGYDFRPMFSGVRSVVARADLALCHLDSVLGAAGGPTGAAGSTAPPELAAGLAATGYDGCSTASGHSLDDGTDGIGRTLDALDRAGVRHSGSARTEGEAGVVTVLPVGAAKVAHLAYGDARGRPLPAGAPWALDTVDEHRILTDARAARAAGADVVVVSVDWGTGGQEAPGARQLGLARRLTAARAGERPAVDLILGTHAHLPQAYEKVNGTWVVYGLGDQIAGGTSGPDGARDPRGDQSTIGRFTFTPPRREGRRWTVTKAEFVPTWFDVDAGRAVDLDEALAAGADVRGVRDRIRHVVLSRGAAKDGLTMGR
ncbi:CapA family protein [Streptomyces sp. NPDC005574]|uniref:CapA family protein n=1 Tax=Streptomyces sp. NPDC005574 TaxID=3156891 RepID=UPI0033B10EAA